MEGAGKEEEEEEEQEQERGEGEEGGGDRKGWRSRCLMAMRPIPRWKWRRFREKMEMCSKKAWVVGRGRKLVRGRGGLQQGV